MENIKKALTRAVAKILDPLVHLLLQHDISHSEFSELARRSYVKMAYKHFAIPGRIKTASRTSVITGLSRQEVVRISKLAEDEEPVTKGPLNRATRVIGGWLQDGDFIDEQNQPRVLPLKGDAGSFEELVSRYGGGLFHRPILDELLRVGAVSRVDKEHVKLEHRGYVPRESNSEIIDMVSRHAGDMLGTIVYNLSSEPDKRRFQRQVSYTDIPESIDQEFKVLCHEKSLTMLIELNQWLAEKKKTTIPMPGESKTRVGLGIYYFKDDVDGAES